MGPIRACYEEPAILPELNNNLRYDADALSLVTYSEKVDPALVFENQNSLREKVCEFKERYMWMNFSLAVYDSETDYNGHIYYDSKGELQTLSPFRHCHDLLNLTKNYGRVLMLKELFTFTKEHVMTTADIPKCHSFPLYQRYKKYENP